VDIGHGIKIGADCFGIGVTDGALGQSVRWRAQENRAVSAKLQTENAMGKQSRTIPMRMPRQVRREWAGAWCVCVRGWCCGVRIGYGAGAAVASFGHCVRRAGEPLLRGNGEPRGAAVFGWRWDQHRCGERRAGFGGDGGAATAAELDSPGGLAMDAAGDLFIADTHNHRVREVSRRPV